MRLVKKRTIEDKKAHVDYLMISSRFNLFSAEHETNIELATR